MEPKVRTSVNTTLEFKVKRQSPELISPAKPTPRELKLLSDFDDQPILRGFVPVIFFYRNNPSMNNKMDPVEVIRKALAEALVHYYPLAGRLLEAPGGKLMVDCTGEGILFVEADADVALDEFGEALHPPFPCFNELLYDVKSSDSFLNGPLLHFQVTRLKCGGIVLAFHFNHTMCDGIGLYQFLNTVGEFARGVQTPSISPIWDRQFLTARVPPQVTHVHRELDDMVADVDNTVPLMGPMVHRSFFFGAREFSAIRQLLVQTTIADADSHVRKATKSEMLTAFLWRCRTIALKPDPNLETRVGYVVNVRPKLKSPTLPIGYYGNGVLCPMAVATVRDLLEHTLPFALRLVQEAKLSVTGEYVRSLADYISERGQPYSILGKTFVVSDTSGIDFVNPNIGWGDPEYGGIAKIGVQFRRVAFYVRSKNKEGQKGKLVLMSLPASAMERFVKEMDSVLNKDYVSKENTYSIKSSL